MPNPVGLNAYPLDEEVLLTWKTPGNGEELELQYYDGELANAFTLMIRMKMVLHMEQNLMSAEVLM